jgi:serralysin
MADYRYGKTVSDVASSDNLIINTLLYGIKWEESAIGSPITLTYSFPYTTNSTALWSSDYNYYGSEPNASEVFGLNETQRDAARSALQSWANVANITFVEVEESGNTVGDIRFAFSSAVTDAWGWSYLPSNDAFSGDIWINPNMDASNLDFSAGGY